MSEHPRLTNLLSDWKNGNDHAFNQLISIVYEELRKISRELLRYESRSPLQTTEVIHLAYQSLLAKQEVDWQDRKHFFRIAARSMRRALVADARSRKRLKRGGEQRPLSLAHCEVMAPTLGPGAHIRIDELIEKMEQTDSLLVKVVDLRYFAGFSVQETAAILDLSPATIKRKWVLAKCWLHSELRN